MGAVETLGRIRFVLCRSVHPGNVGATARALATMGLARLTLVAPAAFPHPDATARARGAGRLLDAAVICARLAEALSGTVAVAGLTARPRELAVRARPPREAAAELVTAAAAGGEVAVVLGNETCGLSNAELALCSFPVGIPADPAFPSLNVAAAAQVMAYELRLAALGDAPRPQRGGPPASFGEVEGLLEALERSMIETGFLDPANPRRMMLRLRRLFARAGLEREEVNILRGIAAAWHSKVDRNTGTL
ncbi:MAG: tRNA (cytosine(32)/uridine(32)-2'-O)-methyltransferase TrmJ [Rhodocyclaceae bacterium]